MQQTKAIFPERLKTVRTKHGWSQETLAAKLGITRQAIVHYEKGLRLPDVDVLRRIALACDCSPNFLLGLQAEMNDQYAHLTDTLPLSEEAIAVLAGLNRTQTDDLNRLLSGADFLDFLHYLSEIRSGAALLDQFDADNPADYVDYLKFKAHGHIDAVIDASIAEGQRKVNDAEFKIARGKWQEFQRTKAVAARKGRRTHGNQ